MEDTAKRPDRRPDRRPGISLGRVLGFPVHLHTSVLFLAILVTVLYGEFVRTQLDVPQPARYAVGLGFVVCLLGSVLLHELGHALTARRYGIGVRGITLEMLGGYTEMDRDAPTPKVDLLVSLAGPAVSLVLGLVAVVATVLLPDRTLINQLAFQLAAANLLVAVFNALPGLPLDGGRALRAAVWAVTRDRHVGTEAAGWVGRAVAAGTAGLVVLLTLAGILSPFGLIFMLLVAFTLWQGAGQSIRVARIGRRFPLVDLAALARPVFPVPSGTPLAEAQRRVAGAHPAQPGGREPAMAVTNSFGRLVALVDRAAAAAVPPERRPWVAVDTVARGIDGVRRIPVDLTGEQVVRTVQEHPGAQYLVTRGEDVIGVLHVADLAQLLEPTRKMSQ
ncbi:site-2 protease family protein [Solwaraspora sp. WMMA2080]|uniref:site-2 protease family protein n=1 Tax=unclassified Solwaraspora TaxID=2627926 RepID=UPI00248B8429|nr:MULTISPECIES: site-2 protease family protein [unclassified Solwaraspora]WBB99478.1 site-2 protease family protein [Solwaraspora sp. WMMA2059]WBC21972.1 site-2 protease family protein [Solwaraspora sp. WMMA2080]